MRTRNTICLLAAALLATVACQRNELPKAPEAGEQTVRLSLTVPTPSTRAGELIEATAQEKAIGRVAVFAYDHASGGLLESMNVSKDDVENIMIIDMRVPRTVLDFIVVANAGADIEAHASTVAELRAATSQFTDNSASSFVMTGKAANIDASSVTDVTVELERIANKVVLKKVTKAFTSSFLQAKETKLKDVRLVNVRRSVNLLDEIDPAPAAEDASYINPKSFVETGTGMIGAADLDYTVTAAGTTLGDGIALYFYPNAAEEAETEEGSDYVTKLVMTFEVGGKLYRYPIGLVQPATAKGRNLVYQVENVTLNLLGNDETDSPNDYISKKSASVSLNVLDWDKLEFAPSFVNEKPVFTVSGIDAFTADSGTKTVTVVSRKSDMIGRSSALGWTAEISIDGGSTYSSTFPTWLTLSATSGTGSLTSGETVTLTYNKAGMGSVPCSKVIIRFVQAETGKTLARFMKES